MAIIAQSTRPIETDRRGVETEFSRSTVGQATADHREAGSPTHYLVPILAPRSTRGLAVDDRITRLSSRVRARNHAGECLTQAGNAGCYILCVTDAAGARLEAHVVPGSPSTRYWFAVVDEPGDPPPEPYRAAKVKPRPKGARRAKTKDAPTAGRGRPAKYAVRGVPVTGLVRWLGADGATREETSAVLAALVDAGDLGSMPSPTTVRINHGRGVKHAAGEDVNRRPAELPEDLAELVSSIRSGL